MDCHLHSAHNNNKKVQRERERACAGAAAGAALAQQREHIPTSKISVQCTHSHTRLRWHKTN